MSRYPDLDGTQHCHSAPPALVDAYTGASGVDPRTRCRLCSGCPFLQPCRTWALEHDVRGVWGATTGEGRDRARPAGRPPISLSDELGELVRAWRASESSTTR